jgi:hypothetical protein
VCVFVTRSFFSLALCLHLSFFFFFSYNVFVSSSFLPLEDAAKYAASIKSFETPPCLMLSFSSVSGHPCRQLVLLQNGNLMASCYVKGVCYVNGPRLARRYFRVSFPEDAASPEYRGPTVASSENSDLFRMLCHFSEQLVYMRCSPAPLSIEELENNVSSSLSDFVPFIASQFLCVYALVCCEF